MTAGKMPLGREGVECALCGARRWNDESVIWIGTSWEQRSPYCAGDCARRANPNTCVHEDHLALCERCSDADARTRRSLQVPAPHDQGTGMGEGVQ